MMIDVKQGRVHDAAMTAGYWLGTNGEGMPYPDEAQQAANAALIAHAPQDLADLIAEVEHLRRGTEDLIAALDRRRAGVPYQSSRATCDAHATPPDVVDRLIESMRPSPPDSTAFLRGGPAAPSRGRP